MQNWTILHYGDPNRLHLAIQNAIWAAATMNKIRIFRGDPDNQSLVKNWVETQQLQDDGSFEILIPDNFYMNRINRFHVIQRWMIERLVGFCKNHSKNNFDLLVLPSQQMPVNTPSIFPLTFRHEIPIYRDMIKVDLTKSAIAVSFRGTQKISDTLGELTSEIEIEAYYLKHQTITPYRWNYDND